MVDKNEVLNIFAQNLRMQRAKKKISQEQLAEQVNITAQHLYRIENCKSSPTLNVIVSLALALDVDLNTLLAVEDFKGNN